MTDNDKSFLEGVLSGALVVVAFMTITLIIVSDYKYCEGEKAALSGHSNLVLTTQPNGETIWQKR